MAPVGTMTRQICENLVRPSPSLGEIRCDFEALQLHFQRGAVALFAISANVVRNQLHLRGCATGVQA